MRYVEVFTTNVTSLQASAMIATCLSSLFEGARVSFDLADVDRVLRIEGRYIINVDEVIAILETLGFECDVMSDEVVDYV